MNNIRNEPPGAYALFCNIDGWTHYRIIKLGERKRIAWKCECWVPVKPLGPDAVKSCVLCKNSRMVKV